MLPDFLGLKKQIFQDRLRELRQGERNDSILSLIGEFRQHEGNRFTVTREDQTTETKEYRKAEFEVSLKTSDLLESGTQAIRDVLATVQERMTKEHVLWFQEVMSKATEEAGTVTHAHGRPFTAELYIEALEPVEFTFDEAGNWLRPTLIIHPDREPRVKQELSRLDTEPRLRARLHALIEQKREGWLAREANRALVD
jgi:hypothetical protein